MFERATLVGKLMLLGEPFREVLLVCSQVYSIVLLEFILQFIGRLS